MTSSLIGSISETISISSTIIWEENIDQPWGKSICCTVIGLRLFIDKSPLCPFPSNQPSEEKLGLYETSIGQTIPEDASHTFQTKLESTTKPSSKMSAWSGAIKFIFWFCHS